MFASNVIHDVVRDREPVLFLGWRKFQGKKLGSSLDGRQILPRYGPKTAGRSRVRFDSEGNARMQVPSSNPVAVSRSVQK